MPHQTFEQEYTFARAQINAAIIANRRHWDTKLRALPLLHADLLEQRLIRAFMDLPLVLRADGFDAAGHAVLQAFRAAWTAAAHNSSEATVMLDLLGWSPMLPAHLREGAVKAAAAAKLFRHCYRVNRIGAQTVWVVSQPASYTQFTTDEIWTARNSPIQLQNKLNDVNEFYSAAERGQLSSAAARVRRWCQRAMMSATRARAPGVDRTRALGWFGAPNMATVIEDAIITELETGFRRMRDRVDENRIIFADDPTERGNDGTLAFVDTEERMRCIYVKRHFFQTPQTRFNLQVYWAVTVLHELSHRVLDTDDHKYDHAQIGIRPAHHIGHAINNADTWAYYAADVSGHLNAGQITWLRTG